MVGFLDLVVSPGRIAAFHQGLGESGYVTGQNVAIEIRSAEGRYNRFPELAADLVRRRVSVIVVPANTPAALAATAATTTIPIVFGVGDDPVKLGLVASLARPGGNATGINFFWAEVTAKRLGLLREMLPAATRVAVLVNPADPIRFETVVGEVKTAAPAPSDCNSRSSTQAPAARLMPRSQHSPVRPPMHYSLVLTPSSIAGAASSPSRRRAVRISASYAVRDYAEAGGLMSYGTSITDAYRQVGVYAGRILKGAKPADLPVQQATKFELVINLRAGERSSSMSRRNCSRALTR